MYRARCTGACSAPETEVVAVSLADADAESVWAEKLDGASLRLADETTADALADAHGGDTEHVDALCSEVVSVAIAEGDNVVTMDHFEIAAEQLDRAPQNDDASPKREAPHRKLKGDGTGGEVVASTEETEEGTAADCDTSDEDEDEVAEPAADTPSESDEGETETVVQDGVEYVPREEYDELESEVRELRGLVDALHRQVKNQNRVIIGEEMVSAVDPEHPSFTDLMTRLQQIEDQVEENANSVQMVRTDGAAGTDKPDDRALLLRQQLYNMAKSGANKSETEAGRATMTRDQVDSALGGGYARSTLLDAMRRAADGHEADINGASDLPPVESITFRKSGSHETQSKLVIDLQDASGTEVRQNLTGSDCRKNPTTANTEDGG